MYLEYIIVLLLQYMHLCLRNIHWYYSIIGNLNL